MKYTFECECGQMFGIQDPADTNRSVFCPVCGRPHSLKSTDAADGHAAILNPIMATESAGVRLRERREGIEEVVRAVIARLQAWHCDEQLSDPNDDSFDGTAKGWQVKIKRRFREAAGASGLAVELAISCRLFAGRPGAVRVIDFQAKHNGELIEALRSEAKAHSWELNVFNP